MNKRKIVLMAATLCMVAILGFGGTLAYLTDTDTAENVFTVGNVDITLKEVFDEENAKLVPGIDVQKEVTITNNATSEPAYVRVHIAFPTILDSGDDDNPQFASYKNKLHWNFNGSDWADGKWNFNTSDIGKHPNYSGWPGNSNEHGKWHTYTTNVGGVDYTVYVGTYETALQPGESTVPAITKVYLDTSLNNADLKAVTDEIKTIKVLVAAEAVQAANFDNAFDAFDGEKGAYNQIGTDGKANLPYTSIFQ